METVEEKIERFRNYNRAVIAAALSKSNRRHKAIPAKLLLCSIIDSLSVAAFPDENGVGKRYQETISNHADWANCDRVSLLQLCGVLDSLAKIPKAFCHLNSWVQSEKNMRFALSEQRMSNRKSLTIDPIFCDVLAKWPCQSDGQPKKLDGKFLPYRFTHNNLFWMYRNKLAHEFRLPGSGLESLFRMEFEPYYQEVSLITDIDPVRGLVFSNRWELVYPTGFFVQIAKNTLESICAKYFSRNTSPFLSYQEGSLWL